MSTYINVVNGGDDLLSKVKGQQQASRFAFAEEQRRKAIEAEKTKTEQKKEQGRKLNPQPYRRELTAHRHPSGGLMGVVYRTSISADKTIRLEVGLPGFGKSVVIEGISDPTLKSNSDITLPSAGSTSPPLAYGGKHIYVSGDPLPYQVWSSDVGGVRYYAGTVAPPASSLTESWNPYVTQTTANKSRVYVLPVSANASLFVYLHNKFKLFRVFTERKAESRTTMNPRPGVWYDQQIENTTDYQFDHEEVFSAYEAFCVLVSDRGVRRVATPNGLDTALRRISPPVGINATGSAAKKSGGGQVNYFGPPYTSDRTDYLYRLTATTQTVNTFSDSLWKAGAAYESLSDNNQVLARQFGLGYLDSSTHRGNFFTPAVFTYLGGKMSLSSSASQDYAVMRAAYYTKAPTRFLAPCVQSCGPEDTEFYVTTTQPSTTSSAVPAASFTKARGYVVKQGESSPGTLYYCWDWGDNASCKAALLALGFSAGDLVV